MTEFYDETKKIVTCILTNPSKGSVCFWDHHPLEASLPSVACPTRYKPKQIMKIYKSEISNENYTIKENVPSSTTRLEPNQRFVPESYEIDGIFCSVNCCLAYIRDNRHNRLYDQSEMLLNKILKLGTVNPAPHWRTLVSYGGPLTIKEFRKSFDSKRFEASGTTLTETKSVCYLYLNVPNFNL